MWLNQILIDEQYLSLISVSGCPGDNKLVMKLDFACLLVVSAADWCPYYVHLGPEGEKKSVYPKVRIKNSLCLNLAKYIFGEMGCGEVSVRLIAFFIKNKHTRRLRLKKKANKETVSSNVTGLHAFCGALLQQSLLFVTLMFIQFVAEQLLSQHPVFFPPALFILQNSLFSESCLL